MSVPNVSEPFTLLHELNRNTTVKQFWEKLRFLRNQKVEITAACSQDSLWVLTFHWLLFCDAFYVSEGAAKAPVRQRENRENTNEAGQKSHRHKQMCRFLILVAKWAVLFCEDGPCDFKYSLLKYFFFPYFSLSDIPPSMIDLLREEFDCQKPFSCLKNYSQHGEASLSDPSSPEVIQIWPKSQETHRSLGAGGVVSHQHWAKQWELQQWCFLNAANSQWVGLVSTLVIFC